MQNKALKNAANGYGDKWGTPPDLWEEFLEVSGAPSGSRYYDPCPGFQPLPRTVPEPSDGLLATWEGHDFVFVNPPFSDIEPWAAKAFANGSSRTKVVMLVPVRTDQPWWHKFSSLASVIFIRGRVQYINHKNGSRGKTPAFPSCLLVFDGNPRPNQYWWPICHQERMKRYLAKTAIASQGDIVCNYLN